MKFTEFKQTDYNIQMLLNTNGDQDNREQTMTNVMDQHIMILVYRSFKNSNPYFWNGLFLSLYAMSGLGCWMMAYTVQSFSDSKKPSMHDTWSPIDNINTFSLMLPIWQYLYDSSTLKLEPKRAERTPFKVIKIIAMAFYYMLILSVFSKFVAETEEINLLEPQSGARIL